MLLNVSLHEHMVFGKIIAGQLFGSLCFTFKSQGKENYKGRIYVNICACVYIFKCP